MTNKENKVFKSFKNKLKFKMKIKRYIVYDLDEEGRPLYSSILEVIITHFDKNVVKKYLNKKYKDWYSLSEISSNDLTLKIKQAQKLLDPTVL